MVPVGVRCRATEAEPAVPSHGIVRPAETRHIDLAAGPTAEPPRRLHCEEPRGLRRGSTALQGEVLGGSLLARYGGACSRDQTRVGQMRRRIIATIAFTPPFSVR